jgi:hypothetical protein
MPMLTVPQMVRKLYQFGFDDALPSFIYWTFRAWHWSLKMLTCRQLQKYSVPNLLRYVCYVVGILQVTNKVIENLIFQ